MYPIEMVTPMIRELTDNGFESLETAEAVTDALEQLEGTALVVVNSVCGCAAANARPGAKLSVHGDRRPDKLYTVFAGVHRDAVAKAREYFLPYPPSSPSMALFKDGRLVHFIERFQIEGHTAQQVAQNLQEAYEKYCY